MTARDVPNQLSQRAHRRLIGGLGFFLPPLLYVVAGLRPTPGLETWGTLSSVSDYYYTGAVAVLVGVVFSLSLFLFTYPGYQGVKADRIVAVVGGAAALGVAVCPTNPPWSTPAPAWWTPTVGVVHIVCALALFLTFILFSLWLFRRSSIPDRRERPRPKRIRNAIYLACGLIMIVCVYGSAMLALKGVSIFVPESIAIEAFAVSWLVKGETVEEVVKRLSRPGPRARR